MSKKIFVIGAGPAGLFAAGTAAANGADVTLLDKNSVLGRKLLITGKGRCNVTNFCDTEDFLKNINSPNPKFMYTALNTFSCYDAYAFFEGLGVSLKIERGNRVFPVSDRAADIRNALKKYILDNGVKVISEDVKAIEANPFRIITDKSEYKPDAVIIATGGKSYPLTGSTGDGYIFAKKFNHKVRKPVPALVALESSDSVCGELAGLSLKNVCIRIFDDARKIVYTDFGEMIFTHSGVSGPIILSASSKLDFNCTQYVLQIDFKPALSFEELDRRILNDFSKYTNKDYLNSLGDLLPKKLIPQVVKRSGIDPHQKVNTITKEQRQTLVEIIKEFELPICSKASFDEAIITSGGVETSQIDPRTMESKIIKDLYFVGEVLDIDANTGGYNLQIAYSTGYLAGLSCSGGKNEY